jgi:hypothetical protein
MGSNGRMRERGNEFLDFAEVWKFLETFANVSLSTRTLLQTVSYIGVYLRFEVKYKARTSTKFSKFPGVAEAMFPLITD